MTAMGVARLGAPVTDHDHIRGPRNAPVTLVEYGDFECPHCGQAYAVVKSLEQLLGDVLRVVFRHFPLTTVHPHAGHAAEAAEAAGAQRAFWPMHDMLFENQDALDDHHLIEYAADLELDVPRFVCELAEHVHAPRVREQFMGGVQSGVNGTPTFFINDLRYEGAYDIASMFAVIEEAAAERRAGRGRGAAPR